MSGNEMTMTDATPAQALLEDVRHKLAACMQCGTCTGSCGSAAAMDYAPREIWRMLQLGLEAEIFESKTFWLCSSCYTCTLRCPRGLPLTEAMESLKAVALSRGMGKERVSPAFYRSFLENVRRYGRVREMEMMGRFFLSLGNPLIPLGFTPLGLKLLSRGKLAVRFPGGGGAGKLDAIYRKARELEGLGS